jgi:hypothetical protein
VRAEVQNPTSREFWRYRTLFDGPRSRVGPRAYEARHTRFEPYFYLRVRKLI